MSLDNALLILGIPPPPKNEIPSFYEAVASEKSEFYSSICFTKYQHFLSVKGDELGKAFVRAEALYENGHVNKIICRRPFLAGGRCVLYFRTRKDGTND